MKKRRNADCRALIVGIMMLTPPTAASGLVISTASLPLLSPPPPPPLSLCRAVLRNPAVAAALYVAAANVAYVARRARIRRIRKRDIWAYRTTKVDGTPWALYGTSILAWQAFVLLLYPVVEPLARLFGHVSFMYDYPNARGVGYILEPLEVQHLSMSKRTRGQIRLDWHAFSVNVGRVGRDGHRHPPSVSRNLPHIDAPRWGVRHWPWRRREGTGQVPARPRGGGEKILDSDGNER